MSDRPFRILLVEDNDDHAEAIERSLTKHCKKTQITRIADGEAALDYILRLSTPSEPITGPRPHLVLLDLRLPKVDGLEILKTIKESDRLKRIPVVALTSSRAHRDVTMAYKRFINSYLVKPFDFVEFSNMIKNLARYWLTCDHSSVQDYSV